MTRIDKWTIAFAIVVILFLVLVLPAQAAKPEAFSGRAEISQRIPRGWRYVGDRRHMSAAPYRQYRGR